MNIFVQSTEYAVNMYEKFPCLEVYSFFVIKYLKFWFIGIFYNAIMHKNRFGQAYYQDIVKRILNKFTLYLSKFNSIFYEF
jgi:hypothetical protein